MKLSHRFTQLKAMFIKKTLEKHECFEKSFLESKIGQSDSWVNAIIKDNNINCHGITKLSDKQLKASYKSASLTEDLGKLRDFPLFANGGAVKTQSYPFWLGHCPHRKVRGRSKLIRLILNKDPRPWKSLNNALKPDATKSTPRKMWTKIGTTLSDSPSEPTAALEARFQACLNTNTNTKTTSSIVSDLIWGGDPAETLLDVPIKTFTP